MSEIRESSCNTCEFLTPKDLMCLQDVNRCFKRRLIHPYFFKNDFPLQRRLSWGPRSILITNKFSSVVSSRTCTWGSRLLENENFLNAFCYRMEGLNMIMRSYISRLQMLIAQIPIYTAYVSILSVRLNYECATSAELRLGDSD